MYYAISIAAVILAVLYFVYRDEIESFVTKKDVCNDLDGRCYPVSEKFSETDKASKLLAELNIFCLNVMKHLRNKYLWTYNSNTEAKNIVKFLMSNYNPDGIIENVPTSDVNTSYVDDKGKEFGICLREKQSGQNQFHNMHDLQFVVLHEMAHMANVRFGHEEDFWEIFKFLLTEAKEAGLHEPFDYSKVPMNYCSLVVSHNPYFDENTRVI